MQLDVHQHLWSTPLLDALSEREAFPFIRRVDGLTVLLCAGEQPYMIDVAAEVPARRHELLRRDRLDLALVALSSPLGIEALPRAEAEPLLSAYLEGVGELGEGFAAWGPVALDGAGPEDVEAVAAHGCVGVSLPAGALGDVEALRQLGPVLARAAELGLPVFVHPGPGLGDRPREAALTDPLWWPALTSYVAQMQAAWLAFMAVGQREHPELTVVFAMLAGGAPLLSERLELRGGPPVDLHHPRVFYDTSGYGPAAVETIARRVSPRQLVYGSDRPVVEPVPTGREAVLRANAAVLLERREVLT